MRRANCAFVLTLALLGFAAQDPVQLFNEGMRLFQEGKTDEALAIFRKVVEANPNDGEAWIWVGTILLTKGDHDGAITAFEKGLSQPLQVSVAARGWVNLGYAYQLGRRDLSKAMDAYAKAVTLKPDLPEAHHNLIIIHLAQNNFSNAVKAGEQAFKALGKPLKPEQVQATFEQVLALIPRDYDRALELLRSLAQQQLPKPEFYALLGQAYEQIKQFSKASLFYGQAAALVPQVAEHHVAFGWTLGQMGRWTEGAKVLERATRLDTKNAFAFVALGIAYCELGRWQEAEITLRRAVELEPQNWVVHVRLATVNERLGKTQQALQEYLTALGIKEDASVLNNVARLHVQQGDAAAEGQRWKEAADAYQQAAQRLRRALQLDPNLTVAKFNLAVALRRLSRTLKALGRGQEAEKVEQEAEKLLREMPSQNNDPSVKLELARLLCDRRQIDEAIKLCREVIAAQSRNEEALNLLGYLSIQVNLLNEAEQAYQQALKLNDKNADAMVGMGVVAYLKGRYDDAQTWFERALKVDPSHPQAKQNLEIVKQAKERGG